MNPDKIGPHNGETPNTAFVEQVEMPTVNAVEHFGGDGESIKVFRAENLFPGHAESDAFEARAAVPNYDALEPEEQALVATVLHEGNVVLSEAGVGLQEETITGKETGGAVHEISRGWEWNDETDGLQQTISQKFLRPQTARDIVHTGGMQDPDIQAAIDTAAVRLETTKQANLEQLQKEADKLADASAALSPDSRVRLDTIHGSILRKIQSIKEENSTEDPVIITAVAEVLANREKTLLEQAIASRIEADALPWTMPAAEVSQTELDLYKSWHDCIIEQETGPQPEDVFKVPIPMSAIRAPEDLAILESAGIANVDHQMQFTREELQRAGVFFLNLVGGGEQPIFGMPIEDEQGTFNVQDRTFLSRGEFERVYAWQQAHGYSIGDHNAKDVQTDMLMFGLRSEGRKQGVTVGATGGRDNKYGQMRSPFVDVGFRVLDDNFGVMVRDEEGSTFSKPGVQRMNTLSLHLVNAHPDFPGLSEIFDTTTAWDQKYISASEFVDKLYTPPPTKEEAFRSIRNQLPTAREHAWVGKINSVD